MLTFALMTIGRKIIAIFLLLGILSNCFNYWILSTSYTFNKAYITSVFCTNKNKPELHCEGKCFMDIKLKELEQKNKHDQDNLRRVIETVAPVTAGLLAPIYEIPVEITPTPMLQQKPIKASISIFHPPKLA
ncbi:MAG: hypothetical protein V4541_12820 [Bacteroidota bacterium]